MPSLIFINKMDRERADFAHAVESIQRSLSDKAVPIALPIGAESKFGRHRSGEPEGASFSEDGRDVQSAEAVPGGLQAAVNAGARS